MKNHYSRTKSFCVQIQFPHRVLYIFDGVTTTMFRGMAKRMTLWDALITIRALDRHDSMIKYKAVYRPML